MEELAGKGIDIGDLTATELEKKVPEPEKRVPLETIMDHAHTGVEDDEDKFERENFEHEPYTEEIDPSRVDRVEVDSSSASVVRTVSVSVLVTPAEGRFNKREISRDAERFSI